MHFALRPPPSAPCPQPFVPCTFPSTLLSYRYSLLLTCFLALLISRAFIVTQVLNVLYFGSLLLFSVALITKIISERKHFSPFLFWVPFLGYSILTSLWSQDPVLSIKRSLVQLLLFTGIAGLSLLVGKHHQKNIGRYLAIALIPFLLLQIISYFIVIPGDAFTGGNGLGFKGFSSHQNSFGGLLLFVIVMMVPLIYQIFNINRRSADNDIKTAKTIPILKSLVSKISPKGLIALLLVALFLLLETNSRAAILSTTVFLLLLSIFTFGWKGATVIIILSSTLFTFYNFSPTIAKRIDGMIYKGNNEIYSTRRLLFEKSFLAAKDGAFFGIGFGCSDSTLVKGSIGLYEDKVFKREKGNSVLALIEEVGILGLLLFLFPIIQILFKQEKGILSHDQETIQNKRKVIVRRPISKNVVYGLITLFPLMLHAQFEAWWVGVGSVFLPLFLLILFSSFSAE